MAGLYGVEKSLLVWAQAPADINGATITTLYCSMKNYRRARVTIQTGALNASASFVVSPKQATAVAGTSVKALTVSNGNLYSVYNTTPGTTDLPAKTTFTTSFTITGTGTASSGSSISLASGLFCFFIEATDLDLANSFDCFGVAVGTIAAVSTLFAMTYELFDPRFEDAVPISGRLD